MEKKSSWPDRPNSLKARFNNSFSIPNSVRIFSYILSVLITTVGIGYYVFAANTSIGTNITTTGSLTVGLSSLFTGAVNASSTLQVTGNTTLYGGLTSIGSATSTFANGFNLSNGCFSINGTCVGGGGGSGTVNSGTAGQISFYDSSGAAVSGTSTVFISTARNVGIGTTTPGAKLSVSGTSLFDGLATFYNALFGNVTATGTLNVSGLTTLSNASTTQITTTGSTYLATSGGNVGIGTTNPNNLIQVANLINFNNAKFNTALGYVALSSNTTGESNTAIGYRALNLNTTGSFNTALGYDAFKFNTTGVNNTAISYRALYSNTTGVNNTANGVEALYFNTTGSSNTALGYNAGSYQADGSALIPNNSVYLGSGARGKDNSDNNSIVIGYNAIGIGANSVVLGNDSITTTALKGNVGIGTTSPSQRLSVQGNGLFSGNISAANMTATGSLNITNKTTGPAEIYLNTNGVNVALLGGHSNNSFDIFMNGMTGTPSFFLSSIGLMGVATDTPSQRLSVQGNALFSGNISAANITATGTFTTSGLFTFGNASGTQLTSTGSTYLATTDGNVGIGTTTPGHKLHIVTSGTVRHSAWDNSTGETVIGFLNAPSFPYGFNLNIGGSARITSASGQSKFEMHSSNNNISVIRLQSSQGPSTARTASLLNDVVGEIGGRGYGATAAPSENTAFMKIITEENWSDSAQGTQLSFSTTPIGSVTPVRRVVFSANGNVGIGTTSPSQLLAVQGNGLFSGNISAANITATGTLTTSGLFTFGNATGTQLTTTGSTYLATTDGNVGIGSTTPGAKLSVSGTSLFDGLATFYNALFGNITATGTLNVSGTGTSTFAGGLQALALNITSSSASSTFANGIQLSAGCFRDASGSCVGSGGGSGTVNAGTTGQFPYYAANGTTLTATSTIYVSTANKVGIGTSTPAYKLDIYGTARANDLISSSLVFANSYSALTSYGGFNGYINASGGLGTGGSDSGFNAQRLTAQGNLINIGSIQAGETLLTKSGTFAAKVDNTTGATPRSVVMGDLNGDGKADLATANNGGSTVSVFINNGDGTFAAKVDYSTGAASNPVSIAIGDLNGDGKADLAATNLNPGNGGVAVFINNGNGTFATVVVYQFTLADPSDVAIGDVNGDGKADLVVANNGWNVVSVFINNGDGTFTTPVEYSTGAVAPSSVAIGDLNGDGKADLAAVGSGGSVVSVFINNGSGTFAAKVDYTTGTGAISVAIGDVNSDGKADLSVANFSATSVSVLINSGSGTFAAKVDYTVGSSPSSVAIGDLNGDGKADLSSTNSASTNVSVLINNGSGTFATKVDYTTATTPYSVAIGDLNGDGKADLAVANNGSNSVSVFINNLTTMFFAQASTGKVGIGTSTPNWNLQVAGANRPFFALSDMGAATDLKHWTMSSQGGNFYIATSSDALATSTIPALTILSNGNVGIGTSSPASRLSIEGTCIDTGAGCADYAELYPASEPVEPGDILMIDSDHAGQVKKARTGDTLIGAVSTNPAVIIEGSGLQLMTGQNYKSNPTKPAVALAGRIPVKVNLEGGEIKIGDPITASLESGIGKKATKSGKIIGYALDSYTGITPENNGKIIVFVNLSQWTQESESSLLAQAIDTIKSWLESMKVFVEDGLVRLKVLKAEKVITDGIEMKDKATGEVYCVVIENGEFVKALGECASVSASSPASDTHPTPADTTSPIITIIGESIITIEKGIAWVDPGATVLDPANGDVPENTNLSIYYKVNGTDTGNEGRDLPQTAIDTNISGTYLITYTATDSSGNIGTNEKTLNIY